MCLSQFLILFFRFRLFGIFLLGLVYIFKVFGIYCSEKSGNPGNDAPFLSFTSKITVALTIEMAGDGFLRVIASHRTQIYQSIACLPISLM